MNEIDVRVFFWGLLVRGLGLVWKREGMNLGSVREREKG